MSGFARNNNSPHRVAARKFAKEYGYDDGLPPDPNRMRGASSHKNCPGNHIHDDWCDPLQSRLFGRLPGSKPKERCPSPVFFYHPSSGKSVAVGCMRWKCPVCAPKLAWRLKLRLDEAVKFLGKRVRHLILTIPDNTYDITGMFNNLRTQLRKKKNGGVMKEYFWTKEFQSRGVRHLHVLVFSYINIRKIEQYWDGFARIKDFRGHPSYLTKYLAFPDEATNTMFVKGERRYSSSRGFLSTFIKSPSSGEWVFYTLRGLSDAGLLLEVFEYLVEHDPTFFGVTEDEFRW